MPKFVPGRQLSEQFHAQAVRPILRECDRNLKYAAALLDHGSEVLGFDTARSRDHHWGPRLTIFLAPKDYRKRHRLSQRLAEELPPRFMGYSTHFGPPDEIGVRLLTPAPNDGPIAHRIEFHTIRSFFLSYLKTDPARGLTAADWLTLSEQKLRTIRHGPIFHDQVGLRRQRRKLHYFPRNVWLFMMASAWSKIGQECHFLGRAGEVGDELGSKLIAGRLAHTIMRLGFLMEKDYAPYSKWYGTAFRRLTCGEALAPILDQALSSRRWRVRERHLCAAYEHLAMMHDALNLTEPTPLKVANFHDRPFKVIDAPRFVQAIRRKIRDPILRRFTPIGAVSQFADAPDLLLDEVLAKELRRLYRNRWKR